MPAEISANRVHSPYAREGADLILNTRSSNKELDAVAAQCWKLGVQIHSVLGDVSDPEIALRMVQEGSDALGKIDILVNNVAIRPHKPILEISNDEWHQVMQVNLYAAFYLIRTVLPGMMKRRFGSIIALGGQAAITGRPNTAAAISFSFGISIFIYFHIFQQWLRL